MCQSDIAAMARTIGNVTPRRVRFRLRFGTILRYLFVTLFWGATVSIFGYLEIGPIAARYFGKSVVGNIVDVRMQQGRKGGISYTMWVSFKNDRNESQMVRVDADQIDFDRKAIGNPIPIHYFDGYSLGSRDDQDSIWRQSVFGFLFLLLLGYPLFSAVGLLMRRNLLVNGEVVIANVLELTGAKYQVVTIEYEWNGQKTTKKVKALGKRPEVSERVLAVSNSSNSRMALLDSSFEWEVVSGD
jgi:hypothetical protein